MIRIEITYTGAPNALQVFNQRVMRPTLIRSADQLARTTRRVVLKHTPVDTGDLRDSVGIFRLNDFERVVFTDVPHSRVVEFGFTGVQIVRPHQRLQVHAFGRPIVPRRVSVIGHTRFVDRRAQPHVRRGFEHAQEQAIPILRRNLAIAT